MRLQVPIAIWHDLFPMASESYTTGKPIFGHVSNPCSGSQTDVITRPLWLFKRRFVFCVMRINGLLVTCATS